MGGLVGENFDSLVTSEAKAGFFQDVCLGNGGGGVGGVQGIVECGLWIGD